MKLIVASLLLVVLQLLKSPTTASDADGESTVAPRIIGGDRVEDVNKYPTFAMVRSRRREDGELKTSFCGGVLVSPSTVLTAAHCIIKTNIESISVTIGKLDRVDDKVVAESWAPHPGYRTTNDSDDDIGVVRLEKPVTTVDPIPMNFDAGSPTTSTPVTAIGFGYTQDSGPLTAQLREVTVNVRPGTSALCRFNFPFDNAFQFCAGGSGRGGCIGDSGGPAMTSDGFLVGLTSYGGTECGKIPTVFTRISAYEDWIKDEVCNTGESQLPSWCEGLDGNPPPPTTGGFGACFSGSSMVDVVDRGPVRMETLQLGDLVRTGISEESYEPVYSFGHLSVSQRSNFLQVTTERSALRLTHDHMVFEKSRGAVPASTLQIDDVLFHVSGSEDPITAIQTVKERGAYAPFTPSGKIVVNDILASSFVALQEKDLELFGLKLSHHWLGHAMQFPQRLLCYHTTTFCPTEQYDSEGVALSVRRPLQLATWLLQQTGFWRLFLISLVALAAITMTILETFAWHPLLFGAGIYIAFKRSKAQFAVKSKTSETTQIE